MAEAIHCPSCTTRYRLRPERLKPAIRRAKCFTCGGEFPVEEVVQRLLAPPAEELAGPFAPHPMDGLDAMDAMDAMVQEELAQASDSAPALSLSDLENTDPGLLEASLAAAPGSAPEAEAEAEEAGSYPPEITDTTLSGYTSARDAIDKLFGPPPQTDLALKLNPDTKLMDLEATLAAFENTLGASQPAPDAGSQGALGSRPAAPAWNEDSLAEASNSTMSLSQEDILAALAATPPHPSYTAPISVPASPTPVSPRPATAAAFAPLPGSSEASEEMLRLKIGEEIYTGLTMPQLIGWVEEGRILENHLVARQHSENWLEAHKVPGLRPAFERLRRERNSVASSLDPGPGDSSQKKSLFGGLFGKN